MRKVNSAIRALEKTDTPKAIQSAKRQLKCAERAQLQERYCIVPTERECFVLDILRQSTTHEQYSKNFKKGDDIKSKQTLSYFCTGETNNTVKI